MSESLTPAINIFFLQLQLLQKIQEGHKVVVKAMEAIGNQTQLETMLANISVCTIACTVLYCTVLYCTLVYFTVLYCTVLYFTVLYCTVLYCTVLYCTVLYMCIIQVHCTCTCTYM